MALRVTFARQGHEGHVTVDPGYGQEWAMSLADAAYALEELAARLPAQSRAVFGLHALDKLLLAGHSDQALRDAAATLELYVATGGVISIFAGARARAGAMACAIREVMKDGEG